MNDFELERYLANDLPECEMQKLREREERDDIFRARCEELRRQNSEILQEHPFEEIEERVLPNAVSVESVAKKLRFCKIAMAAAFILSFGSVAMFALLNSDSEVGVQEVAMSSAALQDVAMAETRVKGMGARLEIWRKSESGISQLNDKSVAFENDELQLRYSVPEKCFGMLFSMDGNGALTLHLGNANEAIVLEPGKMVSLPFAYKLDNAPHFEKFFLLTSRNPFGVINNDVDATLKQEGVEIVSITLAKEER